MDEIKLIALYFYVCERYEEKLQYLCQRFSPNSTPRFSDCEVLTLYLFVASEEHLCTIKSIHRFGRRYLHGWFPDLPSYQAFCARLNRLSPCLQALCEQLLDQHRPVGGFPPELIVDSLPIITASSKRRAKVAPELTAKGYCSTKDMYYYGVKLHALTLRQPGHMPWMEHLVITTAADHDLNVLKTAWSPLRGCILYGDKIYYDEPWFAHWQATQNNRMRTPVKAVKGKNAQLKRFDKACDDLFSKAVSALRQPIESLFNWLIQKTDIQRASRVRSSKGLLTHIFGKIAAAFAYLIFNP